MKYYFTILFVSLTLFSCSKSDDSEENITYVDATVDGALHMFNTFYVTRESIIENEVLVPLVTLAASVERSPGIVMSFKFRQATLGFDACTSIKYIEEGKVYERSDDSFSIEIVESNSYRIRGVFSGNLKNLQTGEVVAISGGGVDVFYNTVLPYPN